MLLQDLDILAKRIAAIPIAYWLEEYLAQARNIVVQLSRTLDQVEYGSAAYSTVHNLIDALQQTQPDEAKLANYLQDIAYVASDPSYQESCARFNKRVRDERQFDQLRKKLKTDLSLEEQVAFDKRLFLQEGMEYCLEFHLLMYQHIQNLPSENEQRHFIFQQEINVGSGKLPGLRTDFMNDEVLEKFIYKILNDAERSQLTKKYFSAKIALMEAEFQPMQKVLDAFKKFIQQQITSFLAMGIERLKSGFFQPYGQQPLLDDVAKQL